MKFETKTDINQLFKALFKNGASQRQAFEQLHISGRNNSDGFCGRDFGSNHQTSQRYTKGTTLFLKSISLSSGNSSGSILHLITGESSGGALEGYL